MGIVRAVVGRYCQGCERHRQGIGGHSQGIIGIFRALVGIVRALVGIVRALVGIVRAVVVLAKLGGFLAICLRVTHSIVLKISCSPINVWTNDKLRKFVNFGMKRFIN